ncbi:MAG: hypothetical protein C0514_02825 [Candidatus Puniceispirillum sp.]|nr:hypothetical protein [Candidatus Puniceispirillum sp.]
MFRGHRMKFSKHVLWFCVQLANTCVWASSSSAPVDISFSIDHFDHADMVEVSKLCSVAYGKDSPYTTGLESAGWDITDLVTPNGYRYGVRAQNGPLSVLSFKGTDDGYSMLQDAKMARMSSAGVFPRLPHDDMHTGFHTYYSNLDVRPHLRKVAHDEFLILAGHSLGGAMCYFSGLEMLSMQQEDPHLYPSHFCSLFTLGAPAAVGPGLCTPLSRIAHLRIAFDNDPVTSLTRGPVTLHQPACRADSGTCYFNHTGAKVTLTGSGLASHTCDQYIEALVTTPPHEIAPIWGRPHPISLAPYVSAVPKPSNISQLLCRFRSPCFLETDHQHLMQHLISGAWNGTFLRNELHRAFYPSRAADTLFYQLWRKHHLYDAHLVSPQDYVDLLSDLHEKYDFLNPLYAQRTLGFFDRIAKKHGLSRETLEGVIDISREHTLPTSLYHSPLNDYLFTLFQMSTAHYLGQQSVPPAPTTTENHLTRFLLSYKKMKVINETLLLELD